MSYHVAMQYDPSTTVYYGISCCIDICYDLICYDIISSDLMGSCLTDYDIIGPFMISDDIQSSSMTLDGIMRGYVYPNGLLGD